MKSSHRLALLRDIYQTVHDETESFKLNDIGADLAYLLGAILTDSRCEWSETRPLVLLLRERFASTHAVWNYIRIVTKTRDDQLLSDRELATMLAALRHWQGSLHSLPVDLSAVATDQGRFSPLSALEIDQLCERLNVGPHC